MHSEIRECLPFQCTVFLSPEKYRVESLPRYGGFEAIIEVRGKLKILDQFGNRWIAHLFFFRYVLR